MITVFIKPLVAVVVRMYTSLLMCPVVVVILSECKEILIHTLNCRFITCRVIVLELKEYVFDQPWPFGK